MADLGQTLLGHPHQGVSLSSKRASLIPVYALGMAMSLFFVISYALCVLAYLLFPDMISGHAILPLLLPWFKFLSWGSFFLGFIESFVLGWFVAIVFGPLYNFFVSLNT